MPKNTQNDNESKYLSIKEVSEMFAVVINITSDKS